MASSNGLHFEHSLDITAAPTQVLARVLRPHGAGGVVEHRALGDHTTSAGYLCHRVGNHTVSRRCSRLARWSVLRYGDGVSERERVLSRRRLLAATNRTTHRTDGSRGELPGERASDTSSCTSKWRRHESAMAPIRRAGRDRVARLAGDVETVSRASHGPHSRGSGSCLSLVPLVSRVPTTIVEAATRLRTGETTAVELVERCLDAIACLDTDLNAFIAVTSDEARAAGRTCRPDAYRGPSPRPVATVSRSR